ncbi:MAG: MG2 domain-containing protein [Bacteroidota bacterium]
MRIILLLVLLGWITAPSQAQTLPEWQRSLQTALDQQQQHLPLEKLYLRTDRTLYQPGETVWLAAYLVGEDLQAASTKSKIIQLELVRPSGQVMERSVLQVTEGVAPGNLFLPANAEGGTYTLRAYTNYLGNFSAEDIFTKTITVQRSVVPDLLLELDIEREGYGPGETVRAFFTGRTQQDQPLVRTALTVELLVDQKRTTHTFTTNSVGEATMELPLPADLRTTNVRLSVLAQHGPYKAQVAKPVPIILDAISLRFFPAGGDWVEGLPARIAFKATNQRGEPADISGTIYDREDEPVSSFTSLHDGLGTFLLPATAKAPLRARLDTPVAGKRTYPLPDPLLGNWQLQTNYRTGDVLRLSARALAKETLQLVMRSQGKIVDCQVWSLAAGDNELSIDVSSFPLGIAQISVFDHAMLPVWERLVFLHPDRQVEVEMTTERKHYTAREEVVMDLALTDSDGHPVSGNFSLAVVDDKQHTYVDDQQPHLLTQFLLQGELRGKIHEPNYYFDPTEAAPERYAALDVLLLTHGWRRFSWRVLQQTSPEDWRVKLQFPAEQLRLRGLAYVNGQQLSHQEVKIVNANNAVVKTNGNGYFDLSNTVLNGQTPLQIRYRGLQAEAVLAPDFTHLLTGQRFQPQQRWEETPTRIVEGLEATPIEATIAGEPNLPTRSSDASAFTDEDLLFKENTLADFDDGLQLNEVVVVAHGTETVNSHLSLAAQAVKTSISEVPYGADFDLALDMEDELPTFQVYSVHHQTYISPVREFALPQYDQAAVRQRTSADKRQTLYWNPRVQTNKKGQASVRFFTNDNMTTFRTILAGVGRQGQLAYAESTFTTAPPLAIDLTVPNYATTGDQLRIPVTITNNRSRKISQQLTIQPLNDNTSGLGSTPLSVELAAGESRVYPIALEVVGQKGEAGFVMSSQGRHWKVNQAAKFPIYRTGFPRQAATSGERLRTRYELPINDAIDGTVQAELRLFPDLDGQLLAGEEAILRQPSGCFEQTSSSNYPNIMHLQYLEEHQKLDHTTRQQGWQKLQGGYDILTSYEVEGGGFSLWGQAPAIPVLTAFGLLQFRDMNEVWPKVDPKLLPRTIDWLKRAYERGQEPRKVDAAYVLYALSATDNYCPAKDLQKVTQWAQSTSTPYLLAIAARLNQQHDQTIVARELVDQLLVIFQANKFTTPSDSPRFAHSVGHALATELTAWTVLAALECGYDKRDLDALVKHLQSKRMRGGSFGPTQATVMALQAILAYERAYSRPKTEGKVLVSINQEVADTLAYTQKSNGLLALSNLGRHLADGNNSIEIRFADTQKPIPYSLSATWQTGQLPTPANAPFLLQTRVDQQEVSLGESVRYSVQLKNTTDEAAYAPMLLLSVPAGLQWDLQQLRELQASGQIDFYEIREPYLVIYLENLAAGEARFYDFDLVAVVPGQFRAPAASAYPYYRDEQKSWVAGMEILVK